MTDRWKPVRDMAFIRELPVEQTGLIIAPMDLNRSRDNTPILKGIVEAIGPKVTTLAVGDLVWYEIDAGEFRLPWDDPVRIMYEGQVIGVEGRICAWLGCEEPVTTLEVDRNGEPLTRCCKKHGDMVRDEMSQVAKEMLRNM